MIAFGGKRGEGEDTLKVVTHLVSLNIRGSVTPGIVIASEVAQKPPGQPSHVPFLKHQVQLRLLAFGEVFYQVFVWKSQAESKSLVKRSAEKNWA